MNQSQLGTIERAQGVLLGLLDAFGGGIPKTKLVKLVYLMDWHAYRLRGETLTGFSYKFDHYGPNAEGNAIVRELDKMADADLVGISRAQTSVGFAYIYRSAPHLDSSRLHLSDEDWSEIHTALFKYGYLDREEITRVAKSTPPMVGIRQGDALTFEQDLLLTDEEVAADPFWQESFAAMQDNSERVTIEEIRKDIGEPTNLQP